MNNLVAQNSNPPAATLRNRLSGIEQHLPFADQVGHAYAAFAENYYDRAEAMRSLATFDQNEDVLALERALETASLPATKKEIGTALAQLVAAFPNAAKADLTAFGAILASDIAAMGPSAFAVEMGCKNLRRTERFIPSIAAVREAIQAQERRRSATLWVVQRAIAAAPAARQALAAAEPPAN